MKFRLLVLWTNLSICSIGTCAIIGKCCPNGQVFSVEKNFTCAITEKSDDRRLYHLKRRLDHEDFAGCEDSRNLTVFSASAGDGATIGGPRDSAAVCLDLLWDEKISRAIPIVLQCQRENERDRDQTAKGNDPSPILTALRVCCRANMTFDWNKRDCVNASDERGDDDAVFRRFKFLENAHADFVSIVRGAPACQHAIVDHAIINATRDTRLLDDGRFEVTLPRRHGEPRKIVADEKNSCLDPGLGETAETAIVRICTGSRYCEREACVRKCCPENEAIVNGSCDDLPAGRAEPGGFRRLLLEALQSRAPSARKHRTFRADDYGLLYGKPCKYGMFPIEQNEEWRLTQQGHFHLSMYRVYNHQEYCMDLLYENESEPVRLCPFVCFDESAESIDESPWQYGLFAILELTSCAFLILTLIVYACLPALRNLHGKTLMCHVASLIVAYATLAAVGLATPSNAFIPTAVELDPAAANFCKFLGFSLLLSWFAAFSWLNVMCFDIWWTFGGLSGAAEIARRRGGTYKKRFVVYSLYAWGSSLLVTILGVTADHTDLLPPHLRPNIGSDSCWFERNVHYYGEILFFVGPVTLQLVANVVFFVLTAIYCSKVKAEIRKVMAGPGDPRRRRFRADRTKLIMNLKLFVVMGISWSLEMVSTYLNHYATRLTWRYEFFYVSDLFNCLQGLVIFVLFVVKGRVYEALRRRFGRGDEEAARAPASQGGLGPRDPYRMKHSASSSTIVSTFGVNASTC